MSSDSQNSSSDTGSIRRLFLGRRFSNASAFSLGTINTVLPDYSVVDPDNSLQVHTTSSTSQTFSDIDSTTIDQNELGTLSCASTRSSRSPPRYSLIKSTLLEWKPDSPVPQSSVLLGNIIAQSEPYEFHHRYPIRSNDPWATLHLYTRDTVPGNPNPSRAQPKVPQVWSCDPVAGMVELDLTSSMTIQQIKISLRGKFLTSSLKAGAYQFVNHEFTIWQRSCGDPRHFNTNEGSSNGKFDGKFIGKYSFPFSFPLPSYVDIQKKSTISPDSSPVSPFPAPSVSPTSPSPLSPRSSRPPDNETRKPRRLSWISGTTSSAVPSSPRGSNETFSDEKRRLPSVQRTNDRSNIGSVASRIPQSFLEKGVTATVVYELSVIVAHGRFKADSRIKTNLSYLPALHPMPASQMRRDAYASDGHIPGPVKDPTGWFALPKATSFGMFSDDLGQRQVAIDCTLYVAEPLSYTRGDTIPCFLRLSSEDTEALECISVPKVPGVRLLRRFRHFEPNRDEPYAEDHMAFDVLDTGFATSGYARSIMVLPATFEGKPSDFDIIEHQVGTARWWVPPDDDLQEASVKHLEGEIHLSPDLQPSCTCEFFRFEYFVEMLALQTREFEPILPSNFPVQGHHGRRRIASVPVEITTLRRIDEPIPVAFTEGPPRPHMKRIRMEHPILEFDEAEVEQ